MIDVKTNRLIWLTWLLIVPAGMVVTYMYFPPQQSLFSLDALGFLVLTIVVSSIPMIISNTPHFYLQWVALVVFLVFGLFAEMLFSQIAIVVLLLNLRLQKEQLFRLPLNWTVFFVMSLVSGLIYYALGGVHGQEIVQNPRSLLIIFIYSLTYFLINDIMLTISSILVYKKRRKILGKSFFWELWTTFLSLPASFILFVLYWEIGIMSVLVVGIPFVSISIILKLYYRSFIVNQDLQSAAEIGHELAERMPRKEVLDLFVGRLTEIFSADYVYVLTVEGSELLLQKKFEADEDSSEHTRPLKKGEGIAGHVWAEKKAVLFHTKKEWSHIERGYMPAEAESIISVPIIRSEKVRGVVLIASKKKRAFEKTQLMIIDILSTYFAVALENAKYYERTLADNERCPLTKLYNFRYLQKRINEENKLIANGERKNLSAIMLDIDHFKNINDTYGHESGNEILCQLADRIVDLIGNSGTVIRFGGEEFVILLPEVEKKAALNIAEFVRQTIAQRPFILREHFQEGLQEIPVHITASIGVATVPEDADDLMALIRHADRALYVGAKRMGRNKVAEYVR